MKKTLFLILTVIILAFTFVLTLILWSAKPNESQNGFNRTISETRIELVNKAKINPNLFTISGATKSSIYLSGQNPQVLIRANSDLSKIDSINLTLPVTNKIITGFDLIVDSPKVSLFARNVGAVYYTILGDTIAYYLKLDVPLFSRTVEISNTKCAMRAFDSTRRTQYFQILNTQTGGVEKKVNIFENQTDGGFSTDGLLQFDTDSKKLVYLQFYQNKFFIFDSLLNLLQKGNTIDSTEHNTVLTRNNATNNKEGSIMPSVPLQPTNRELCVSNGIIYIISNLKADNEKQDFFSLNSVVDMYSINEGYYKGSFYLPHIENQKVESIRIYNNTLIALYSGYIATFAFK